MPVEVAKEFIKKVAVEKPCGRRGYRISGRRGTEQAADGVQNKRQTGTGCAANGKEGYESNEGKGCEAEAVVSMVGRTSSITIQINNARSARLLTLSEAANGGRILAPAAVIAAAATADLNPAAVAPGAVAAAAVIPAATGPEVLH